MQRDLAALDAGRRTCNPLRILLTFSIRVGFHKPAGDTVAPPSVMPDLLSSENPDKRAIEQRGKDTDVPASIATTATDDGSLLISVRIVRSSAGWVAYAVMFLFPAPMGCGAAGLEALGSVADAGDRPVRALRTIGDKTT